MQDPAVPSSVPVEADRTVDGSLGDDVKRGGMVQFDLCVLLEVSELLVFLPEQILLFCFSRFTKAASGRGRSRSPLLSRKKSGVFEARSSDLASQ